MKKYLVLLRPLEEFFFGSEKNFKDKYSKDYTNQDNITYVLKSRQYPQQTTILGMLRKEVLVQSGFELNKKRKYGETQQKKMSVLIGERSFDIRCKDQDFGKIKEISPLFIYNTKDKHFYSKVPKDHKISNKENASYDPFRLGEKTIRTNINQENYIKVFEEKYKSKVGISGDFINLSSVKKEIIKSNDIFEKFERIGIDTKSDKDGYYKQMFYRLKENLVFAFFLDSDFELNDNIVYLGKGSCAFKMKVEKNTINLKELTKGLKQENKIVLLSDGYFPKSIENDIEFSIRDNITFRNLHFNNEKKLMKRIETKYNLWEKGSVIYVSNDNKNKVVDRIKQNKNIRKIGYNYII